MSYQVVSPLFSSGNIAKESGIESYIPAKKERTLSLRILNSNPTNQNL
jgi:hypothetical protein